MAEHVWLTYGDKLPAVAVSQALLKRTGINITVDGDFGRNTVQSVRQFQTERGLGTDGAIGSVTWPRLVNTDPLPILDCIDIFDPDLYTSEVAHLSGAGGSPIVLGGACNGIAQAAQMIRSQARGLFLLRFHGHGAPGLAGMSMGQNLVDARAAWDTSPAALDALSSLRGVFGPYGCIQFMHCSTGAGESGRRFLQAAANATGVPVTAAYHLQYAGTPRQTMRYEGPTRTCIPGGGTLTSWARSLPAFVGRSVI
jgi:hypothetical protein